MTGTPLFSPEAQVMPKETCLDKGSTPHSRSQRHTPPRDASQRKPFACLNVCNFVGRIMGRDEKHQSGGELDNGEGNEANEALLQRTAEVKSSLSGLILLAPPQRFSDLFTTGKMIGEGGYGIVYRAKPTDIGVKSFPQMVVGCPCAVKKTKNAFQEGQPLDDIHRSALQLSAARSAAFFQTLTSKQTADNNIVLVHGQVIEPNGGVNALIMELLAGPDLLTWANQSGAYLKECDVAYITRQVFTALHYLHRVAGALHRDVKPDNFGFAQPVPSKGPLPTLKLYDFGTCWILPEPVTDDTASNILDLHTVGTCHWLAPEVLDQKCGAMSDVWSAGLLVHYLLIGDLPWDLALCRNEKSVKKTLKWNSLSFDADTLDHTSALALNFVSSLLLKKPLDRASTSAALEDPWLKTAAHSTFVSHGQCSTYASQSMDGESTMPASSSPSSCTSMAESLSEASVVD